MTAYKTTRLGSVAEFIRGINFKPDDVVPVGTPGTVACMRTKNVQTEIDLTDVWAVDEKFAKRAEQILHEGDLLVSSANSWNLVGKCCWIPQLPYRSSFGGFVAVLRGINKELCPRFLYWWFTSPRIQALARSFGNQTTNISNLNFERCLNLEMPLPPLSEQRRIAAVLDAAEALRAKRRAALAQLDSLTQAIFIEMFGDPATNPKCWPTMKIADLLESASYGTSEKSSQTGSIPVLRMNNITSTGRIDFSSLKYMELPLNKRDKFLVRRGDVLFNRTNSAELVGKSAIFRHDREMAYAGYLIRLRVNDENDPEYLAGFLNSKYAKKMLANMCKSIVGMANINATEIQAMGIAKPPLKLQRNFAKAVECGERSRSGYQKSAAELDTLFASLQHRAFRGEL